MSALRIIRDNCCSLVLPFMNILSHEQRAVKSEFDTIEPIFSFLQNFLKFPLTNVYKGDILYISNIYIKHKIHI